MQRVKCYTIVMHWSSRLPIITVLVLATALRLYQLPQRMVFRGDEGRDARIVRTMLLSGRLVLEGPPSSVHTTAGTLMQGPLTYYLFAPALLLANFSPVGPAVLTALFSVATVGLLWWVGRRWFHPTAGLMAATAFALSPWATSEAHHAWNPNFVPFLALAAVAGAVAAWQHGSRPGIMVSLAALAAAAQFHASALVVAVPTAIAIVLAFRRHGRAMVIPFAFGLGVALLVSAPVLVREVQAGFPSVKIVSAYMKAAPVQPRNWVAEAQDARLHVTTAVKDIIVGGAALMKLIVLLGFLALITSVVRRRWHELKIFGAIIVPWTVTTFVMIMFYREPVFSHYLTHFWPAIALGWGWVVWQLSTLVRRHHVAVALSLSLVTIIPSATHALFFSPPQADVQEAQRTAEVIAARNSGSTVHVLSGDVERTIAPTAYFLERAGFVVENSLSNASTAFLLCSNPACHTDSPDFISTERIVISPRMTVVVFQSAL